MKGNSFYDCLDWCPQERNVFHIIDRSTGKPVLAEKKLISQESFFFLNFINCHDDDDSVVIDLVAYDSPEILHQMFLEKLREGKLEVEDKSKILRFIIPLNPSGDIGNDLICRYLYLLPIYLLPPLLQFIGNNYINPSSISNCF